MGSSRYDLQCDKVLSLSIGKFTFHVDHFTFVYLVSETLLTWKLAQWTVLLQEYEFNIVHRPGVQHVVADCLSRIEFGEAPTTVADDFSNTGIMTVSPKAKPKDDPDGWLMDIVYFLSQSIPPVELSKAKRKWLGVRSRAFSLMNGNFADMETSSVDSSLAGVRVRHSSPTRRTTCRGRLSLKAGIWRSTHKGGRRFLKHKDNDRITKSKTKGRPRWMAHGQCIS
jgi:hypothetical protein